MAEEATMVCIDNSEWMRNGDYSSNRFDAQYWAYTSICGAKHLSNRENTVGALTMAGKGVHLLLTPTNDFGEMLSCIRGLSIGGEMNLAAGLQVALLALKHRQNKKQRPRIILFAGSPVKQDERVLEMIGRKLKKHSVALDVVNFGQEDAKKAGKLEALVAAANNSDNSRFIHIPPGDDDLSDVLMRLLVIFLPPFTSNQITFHNISCYSSEIGSSPICNGDVESRDRFAAVGAGAEPGNFGVDPDLDPELAVALRVSVEEERARQAAAAKKAAQEAAKQEKGEMQSTSQDVSMTENANGLALLRQVLAMSRDDSSSNIATRDTDMSEADFVEDQELLLALQLPIWDNPKDEIDITNFLSDQAIVLPVPASLPGVDPDDRSIEDSLASMQSQSENDEDKEQKEDKK